MNKRLHILFLLLSILIIDTLNAQDSKVDSLQNLLSTHIAEDTVKVNLLNIIAYEVYLNDKDKTLKYATQAGELSDRLKFIKGKAESFWLMGIALGKSDVATSLDYYQKALKIGEQINYKPGTAKYLNACANAYKFQGNNILSIEYYLKAIKISEEINDKLGIAKYLQNLSILYSRQGNYLKAINGYKKALKILDELNEKSVRPRCLNNLGYIYEFQGNYPLALEYYHKSLKINEEQNDRSGCFSNFISISNIYSTQFDYQLALDQIQKALKIAEGIKDKQKIAICLDRIGSIYLKTNNPLALEYAQKTLKIANELADRSQVVTSLLNIGDFYLAHSSFPEAEDNYQKALKIAIEMDRKRSICELLDNLGTVSLRQKKYAVALNYSQKSLELANDLKLLSNQKDIHNQLSEIYAATNDYKNAYIHNKIFKELNDSIFNEKNTKKIAELVTTYKYENEKQVAELQHQKAEALHMAEQRRQKLVIISLVVGFILMFSLAAFVYRSYRIKLKTNIILTQQKHEIEELNEEYQVVNEELLASNEELVITKKLVEESEEKLRLLIKNSNDILVLVNEKGEQFFISDAAKNLTGYNVSELLGGVEDVIYPDDVDMVRQHWERVLADKNVADCIQYRHKHKENGYVWFEAVAQNFIDHPNIKAVVANIRDITVRKKVEQALQKSEAEKAKLMAMEIERIGLELESNQKSVTAATLKLIQNSERDAQTIERLMEIEENTNTAGKQKINTLISDCKRISYNSNWDEFEILFEKVHTSFYEKLNTQLPTLTANERKICAFLKLNMSSKEIAQITFQSEEALKKARLRLRQKLEISRETNLVTFLQNI